MLDIISFGSITIDLFVTPSEMDFVQCEGHDVMCFPVGAKIGIQDFVTFSGGGAANTAIGFAKMDLKTGISGLVGTGDKAELLTHQLRRYNINTESLVVEHDQRCSTSVIFTTPDGRRTVFCQKIKSTRFDAGKLLTAPRARSIYLGHLSSASESILHAVPDWQLQSNGRVFWNPGKTQFKQGLEAYARMLPSVELLILNIEEAELFTGRTAKATTFEELGLETAYMTSATIPPLHDGRPLAAVFLEYGVQGVCITDGAKGAQYYGPNGVSLYAPPLRNEKPTNTLGAGDAFSVGLVSGLLHGHDIKKALHWGTLNADSTIQTFGAQNGQLTHKALQAIV